VSDIDSLDFEVLCRCGNKATVLVEMHPVDYCDDEEQVESEFRCDTCRDAMVKLANKLLHPSSGSWCSSCGLIFKDLSDIIKNLRPIP
jgi:hypothetical protein